jgi:hypothetical protein
MEDGMAVKGARVVFTALPEDFDDTLPAFEDILDCLEVDKVPCAP